MLPLLDLHGVRRLEFHNSILEELRDKLITEINKLGQNTKERDVSESLLIQAISYKIPLPF